MSPSPSHRIRHCLRRSGSLPRITGRSAASSMKREGSLASSREAMPRTSRWEIRTVHRDFSRILRSSASALRSTAGSSIGILNPERTAKSVSLLSPARISQNSTSRAGSLLREVTRRRRQT